MGSLINVHLRCRPSRDGLFPSDSRSLFAVGLRLRFGRVIALAVTISMGAAIAGAQEPTAEATPGETSLWRGRVFERGTINPVVGARVIGQGGLETITDEKGRFELTFSPGKQSISIQSDDHEPLLVTETLVAGQGFDSEYRLTPREEKKRFRSRTRGDAPHAGERFSLRDEELHMAPGSLGDPFRTIALMPGVAAPVPLLPLWVVRGSSPGTNGFFLDGMRLPQLFHFLIGGGVVASRLVDRVDFYPSAYDASFGRFAGGIIDGETRAARNDGYHAELELKVYDLGAIVEAKLPKGVRLTVSGKYGFPGYLVRLFQERADLQYWDFQLRLDWKGLTVQVLGSFDLLSIPHDVTQNRMKVTIDDRYRLAFYRLQIRDREHWGRVDFEAALVGGIDEMAAFGGVGVRKLSLAGRINVSSRWKRFRLLGGAEVELQRFTPQIFGAANTASQPDELGEFAGDRGGVVGGAYLEGVIDLVPNRLAATVGTRLDFYHAGSVSLVGIDPRVQLKAKLLPQLSVSAGTGLYQQAPSFPIGLPGIDTFALQLGLQRAWQSMVKIEAVLPKGLELSITGYYQRFHNLNDVVLDFSAAVCTSLPPESLSGLAASVTRQLDGASYGMEVLLRRTVGRFTGWVSYTLSKSERLFSCGLRPSDFDQRHLLNVVLQVRLPWKLIAGAHLYVATGRPYTAIAEKGLGATRNDARLPDYVQLDLRIDREWLFKRWAFGAFLEVLNVTATPLVLGQFSSTDAGTAALGLGQLNALRLVLPTIGIRARL